MSVLQNTRKFRAIFGFFASAHINQINKTIKTILSPCYAPGTQSLTILFSYSQFSSLRVVCLFMFVTSKKLVYWLLLFVFVGIIVVGVVYA